MPLSEFIIDFFAGGVSGVIAKTTTAPIQRVKLILQTMYENKKVTTKYKGFFDCLIRCAKQDGILSLWRGNGVNVIRYFPTQALNFSFKDLIGRKIDISRYSETKWKHLIASILTGGIASFCTVIFVYPLDYARTRLSVDMGKNKEQRQFLGLSDCIKKTFNTDGVIGLYRGFWISAVGLFIYRGLYFGLYDFGKVQIINHGISIIRHKLYPKVIVCTSSGDFFIDYQLSK